MLLPDASPCLSLEDSSLSQKGLALPFALPFAGTHGSRYLRQPVKELRKTQGLLLADLWSLSDLITETGSQPLVKEKPIQHRKDKP